jgi:hypothetical protein
MIPSGNRLPAGLLTRAAACLLLCLAPIDAALAQAAQEAPGRGQSAACVAAKAPADYGTLVKVPDGLKAEIDEYKAEWRAACGSKEPVSLNDLLTRARRIEAAFAPILDAAAADQSHVDDLHLAFSETYPSFIPAFDGSLIEFQYFSPNLDDFRDNEVLGTDEDRHFLNGYTELIGDATLYPWLMQTWDHGGCVRFGEYKWADALKALDALRASTKGQAYRAMIDSLEEAMKDQWQTLGMAAEEGKPPTICTCENRGAVVPDLETILAAIAERPGYDATRAALKRTLAGVAAGSVPVLVEAEQHCSGG